jgi:nucleotide-binding universal stress UspA family protein
MPTTYVACFDGSANSWRAVAYAVGLARRHGTGCRLVVVAVAQPAERFALWPETVPLGRAASTHETDELTTHLTQLLADADVTWRVRAETGGTFVNLVRAADEQHADAVVIGAGAGRWSFKHRSVANRLTALARYPVIVVP